MGEELSVEELQRRKEVRRRKIIHERKMKRMRQLRRRFIGGMIVGVTLLVLLLSFGIVKLVGFIKSNDKPDDSKTTEEIVATTEEDKDKVVADLLSEANLMAAGYDYDNAIDLVKNYNGYAEIKELSDAITSYETQRDACVAFDNSQITHIFFHSLVYDTSKAFGDKQMANGYNQVMTTVGEFNEILNEMYERGYILVGLHDIAIEKEDENGKKYFESQQIMLPEGKKAFVMSQDDVCYYAYMNGDGFANRIVIDENGRPTCEMDNEDGTTTTGDYDLVPILETFIETHPDFSYRGARAVLAFTGYDGILGYRTSPSFVEENPDLNIDIESEKEKATKVAEGLKTAGYELASHSWGHRYMNTISMEDFKKDTDRWEKEVEPLIGETDIILYPFGEDISTAVPYNMENERYKYLDSVGFKYYCNVDSSTPAWVQIGDDYLRQGRRNIDGYRMYQDYVGNANRLSDIIDVQKVFDATNRPLPVPDM